MRLEQGQVWKKTNMFYRIVQLERKAVEYKEMVNEISPDGTHRFATKKYSADSSKERNCSIQTRPGHAIINSFIGNNKFMRHHLFGKMWPGVGCAILVSVMTSLAAESVLPTRISFAEKAKGWDVSGVPGCAKAVFTAGYADGTNRVLRMTADKATATFKSGKLGVDLNKTPIMRWRWKAVELPAGADGRDGKLDDQAIGLYISTGGMFSQKSVAYRWETDTPRGETGRAKYAAGVVSIYWISVRNKDDMNKASDADGWFIEEANVAEAFKEAFKDVPGNIGLGISCNSQFTGTKAEALLDWVEFLPANAE